MSHIICAKCGNEVSNEFGITLTFCTNCGASLNIHPERTLSFENTAAAAPKQKNQFPVILLTSLLTSVFLVALAGGGWYFWSRFAAENPAGQDGVKPTPRLKTGSAVGTADLAEISFTSFRYEGLIYGGEKNRSVTSRVTFRADGNALKIDGEINYENQKMVGKTVRNFRGTITAEQFRELAETAVENDFLNEPDAADRITDATDYRLKIKYTGGEKEIITSNTGKDSPEIDAILQVIKNLQNQIEFTEVKIAQ